MAIAQPPPAIAAAAHPPTHQNCRERVGRGSSAQTSAIRASVNSSGGRAVLMTAHDGRANHAAISTSRSADQTAAAATCSPAGAHSAAAARDSQPAGSTTKPVNGTAIRLARGPTSDTC